MTITFTFNELAQDWEFKYKGTLYAENTFMELASVFNKLINE